MIVIIIGVMYIYCYCQNNLLQITKYNIINEKIPVEFDGFKIVHISDYHSASNKRLNNALINTIKEEHPDIIVVTGDMIGHRRLKLDKSLEFINKLSEITKVYYISGNHETDIENYDEYLNAINKEVVILDNKKTYIEKNNERIYISGLKDPEFYDDNMKKFDDYIKSLNIDQNTFNILLSHRPELFNYYVENGIDLVFSGHAHGGQWIFPFTDGLYAPHQGILPKLTRGLHEKENTSLIISRGVGNVFPIRINNRPELIITTLKNT